MKYMMYGKYDRKIIIFFVKFKRFSPPNTIDALHCKRILNVQCDAIRYIGTIYAEMSSLTA